MAAATEEPVMVVKRPPGAGPNTLTPGAAISGFMRPVRVNPLLELANRLLLYALKVEVVRDTSAAEGAVMVVLGSGLRKVTSGAINPSTGSQIWKFPALLLLEYTLIFHAPGVGLEKRKKMSWSPDMV